VWRWRRDPSALDERTVDDIIRKLMEMDTKLDDILDAVTEDDEGD